MSLPALLPDRHPQMNFFIADIFDSLLIKDDMASMEHPVFSLSKNPDMRVLEYKHGNSKIKIKPSTDGLPTIFDKDVLLYLGSILMEQINKGIIPSKTIRFSARDLLLTTNRCTDGKSYTRLKKAFERLHGVSITTNIKTNGKNIDKGFHILESYEVIEKNRVNSRMVQLEATISDWFYNSLIGGEVKTINRKYFQLRKSLERRIYELARKHCGEQPQFSIRLEKLRKKTGSTAILYNFRAYVKKIIETNHLPDYQLFLADNDIVHFSYTPDENTKARSLIDRILPKIKPETIERAKAMTIKAGTGWDFYALQEQFTTQLMEGFKPDNVDGAFIGFIKKKTDKCP